MSSEICHRKSKAPGVFSADRSKAVPLLQFCFVCMLEIAPVPLCLVMAYFSSFFLCLGKAVLCDCGISWITPFILLPMLSYYNKNTALDKRWNYQVSSH